MFKKSKKIKTYFKKVRIYLEAVAKFEKKNKMQAVYFTRMSRESLLGPHRGCKWHVWHFKWFNNLKIVSEEFRI